MVLAKLLGRLATHGPWQRAANVHGKYGTPHLTSQAAIKESQLATIEHEWFESAATTSTTPFLLIAQAQVRFAADDGGVGDVDGVVLVGADDTEVAFHGARLRHGVFALAESAKKGIDDGGRSASVTVSLPSPPS